MKKKFKCLLCDKNLEDSQKIFIKNIPESAQGFKTTRRIVKKDFSTYLFQCNYCNHVQLANEPVHYYKEVVRSVGISREMKNYRKIVL